MLELFFSIVSDNEISKGLSNNWSHRSDILSTTASHSPYINNLCSSSYTERTRKNKPTGDGLRIQSATTPFETEDVATSTKGEQSK